VKRRQKNFTFEIDGTEHTIDIEFTMTSLKSIKYDGHIDIDFKEHPVISLEYLYSFEQDNHRYDIKLPWKFRNKCELFIDNISVDTGEKVVEVALRHDLIFSGILLLIGGILLVLSAGDANRGAWLLYCTGILNILLSIAVFKKFNRKIFAFFSGILLLLSGFLFLVSRNTGDSPLVHLVLVFAYFGFGINFLFYNIIEKRRG
jgi:hypothetical protein